MAMRQDRKTPVYTLSTVTRLEESRQALFLKTCKAKQILTKIKTRRLQQEKNFKVMVAMGISVVVAVIVVLLDLFAFVFAVGAEMRRNTGRVVPDKYDEHSYCEYKSDASTTYGLFAFGLLLLSQVIISTLTRCLCSGHRSSTVGTGTGSRAWMVTAFIISWLSFLIAEACLLAGSVRNAYHTKYWGYYIKHDSTTCATLRKGVFAAAAAFMLVTMVASLLLYWSYSRAEMGGWVKHRNEEGVTMADVGPK